MGRNHIYRLIRQAHAFGRAEAAEVFVAERLQASAAPGLLLRAGDARHAQVAQDVDGSGEAEDGLFLLQMEDAEAGVFQLAAELLGRRVVQPVARQRAYLVQVAQAEGGEGQHAAGAEQRGGAAEEVAGRGEPLEGGARRQQVQPAGQGAGLGITRFEGHAGPGGQFLQAEAHLGAEVVEVEQRGVPRVVDELRIQSRAAAELGDAVEAGVGQGMAQQGGHLLGHLLLHARLATIGGAGAGKSFGYQAFVHRSCR